MPYQLSPFLTPAEWEVLIHDLDPEDRQCIVEMLLRTFEGEDSEKMDPKDLAEVLRHARSLADDFRSGTDDFYDGSITLNVIDGHVSVRIEKKRGG